MSKNTVLIIASVSFADEKGVMCYAGEKVEISQEMLDKQNELCEKFDLPKHTVVETAKHTVVETAKQGEETKPATAKQGKETKPATAKKEDDL